MKILKTNSKKIDIAFPVAFVCCFFISDFRFNYFTLHAIRLDFIGCRKRWTMTILIWTNLRWNWLKNVIFHFRLCSRQCDVCQYIRQHRTSNTPQLPPMCWAIHRGPKRSSRHRSLRHWSIYRVLECRWNSHNNNEKSIFNLQMMAARLSSTYHCE